MSSEDPDGRPDAVQKKGQPTRPEQQSPNFGEFRVNAERVHQNANEREKQRQIDDHGFILPPESGAFFSGFARFALLAGSARRAVLTVMGRRLSLKNLYPFFQVIQAL